MNETGERKRRLFFALWPDPEVRRRLAEAARRWTPHPLATPNLHMTLVFLGARGEEELRCIIEAVSGIRAEPFDIELDYLGHWGRAGIQWLGSSRIPPALNALVGQLQQRLQPCGYEPEKRRFVPHVTLARKVRKPRIKAGLEPIRWSVREFVLAESVSVEGGVSYQVLQRWPLGEASL
ncbi:MAG TPA: RNA 2',3'-cyclic phosphodiesterase [Gammaproteobacteria bacterium]|nr:RNA 2',3'-cyclic phosphodiesterase [Gammaproteobacteria bacterium]